MRKKVKEKVSLRLMDFDPDIFCKIVSHLMENTIEFTPENRKVEIRVSVNENEDFFTLRESDHGKDISQGKVLVIEKNLDNETFNIHNLSSELAVSQPGPESFRLFSWFFSKSYPSACFII